MQSNSLIYVISAQGSGRVKIGHTTDLQERLKGIQTGCPYPLIVLATYPGGTRAIEIRIHETFRSYRRSGEWFEFPALMGALVHQTICGLLKEPSAIIRQKKTQKVTPIDWLHRSLQGRWPNGWWEVKDEGISFSIKYRWRSPKMQALTFPRLKKYRLDTLMGINEAEAGMIFQDSIAGHLDDLTFNPARRDKAVLAAERIGIKLEDGLDALAAS